jgi:hypothetical protein
MAKERRFYRTMIPIKGQSFRASSALLEEYTETSGQFLPRFMARDHRDGSKKHID